MSTIFADEKNVKDQEAYRDRAATISDTGSRHWIYPKKPSGSWHKKRAIVATVLLIILFGLPFIKVNGSPLVLLNILERKFIIFGVAFWPADFHLIVLMMLSVILSIVVFTSVFGRIWCGWACPQTVFMEMVFRKIEYWIEGDYNAQIKLNRQAWNGEKIAKKVGKQTAFITISILIAHTFLSYIVGLDQVLEIVSSPPSHNIWGFVSMVVFTGLFYGVFARFREQACHMVCPYGRFQSVLVDERTLSVTYDWKRGEPRGHEKKNRKPKQVPKNGSASSFSFSSSFDIRDLAQGQSLPEEQLTQSFGDCVDCHQCVKVCPAGIDIRNGIQLECVQCTACIDACDEVMEKVDKPKGLIRYTSAEGVSTGSDFQFTPRVWAYSAILIVMLSAFGTLMMLRPPTEAIILRAPGILFQELPNGNYSNIYDVKVLNKTFDDLNFDVQVTSPENAILRPIGSFPIVEGQSAVEARFILEIPATQVLRSQTNVTFQVLNNGEVVEAVNSSFIGPERGKKE